jgi:hypothetical protein
MIRFLFRLLALGALAVAVIFAVLDATRSIAASALVMTPLATSWIDVSPDTLSSTQQFVIEKIHPLAWNPAMIEILKLPGFVVFAVMAFILFAIGRRPERHGDRIAA